MDTTPQVSTAREGAERREQTHRAVEHFIAERQEMLTLYSQVAGLQPVAGNATVEEAVEQFCQLLVDYIAAGHFAIYDRLSSGEERRKGVLEVAERVYPELRESTQSVLDFNERYQDRAAAQDDGALHDDLSRLGEVLANRIELEDELISRLH